MEHSQTKVIQNTKYPITKHDIVKGLKALGLKADSKVEVHVSLFNFGYIINKEYDIIDALVEVIHDGVIILPAHTSEYTDPTYWENPPVPNNWIPLIKENRRPFDKDLYVPERLGKTPIAFLNYPGVERTNHPFISFAVYNQTNDPSWIEHSLNEDDDVHPLLKLSKETGKILFMGTDFQTCTSIHLSEKYSEAIVKREDTVALVENGEIVKKTYRSYDFDDEIDRFDEIGKMYLKKYEHTPLYKQVKIGLATCTLIDAEALYEVAYKFHINHKKITSN